MADKYVAPTGTDDGAAGRGDTVGDPYLTIQYAINNFPGSPSDTIFIADGEYAETAGTYGIAFEPSLQNNKTFTLVGESVSGTILAPTKEFPVYISSDTTTVDISSMTIRSKDATNGRAMTVTTGAVATTLKVDDCVLGTLATAGFAPNQVAIQVQGSSKQHSVEVSNSMLYGHGNKAVNFLDNCQTAIYDNNVIVSNAPDSTQAAFWVRQSSDSLVVKNNDITSETGIFNFDAGTSPSVGILEYFGNTIDAVEEALLIPGVAPAATLYVNKVRCNDNIITHAAASNDFTIHIGEDGALNEPLELIEIRGNTITRSNGLGLEHVLFLAPNMEGADVSNNTVNGGAFGLVIKGKFHTVKGNLIIQGSNATTSHAAYLKGAYGCTFENNTLVCNAQTSGSALTILPQNGITVDHGYNVIQNNILDGRLGQYAARFETDFLTDIWDYNDFQGGQLGFISIDTLTDPTDLATLQAMWAVNATTNEGLGNDANSFEVDPQYKDAAGGDYTPQNSELVAGGAGGVPIGSEVPPLGTAGGYRARYA